MKTSALAQTSPKGRALIAVVIAAVLVVIGVGVTRAAAEGEPQKIAAAAASTTSDPKGAATAPATLEEIIEDAKKTTFYDTDQFLWEHYGMTEYEFERTYGVDDDVLDPYEAPKPSLGRDGGTAPGDTAPSGTSGGNAFATRQGVRGCKGCLEGRPSRYRRRRLGGSAPQSVRLRRPRRLRRPGRLRATGVTTTTEATGA